MTLRLFTAPVNLPVSLATVKTFLRVDGSTDDALITQLIKAATETGEGITRRSFITQTLDWTFDAWPSSCVLNVPRPRLQSVTSVKYLEDDATEHTWTDYTVDAKSEPGVIVFEDLPGVTLEESGAVTVRFVAGYGLSEADVPDHIKLALMQLVSYWYETRMIGDVPAGIRSMFMQERVIWF